MNAKQIAFTGQASSVEELAGAPAAFINATVDAAGAISARPGITTYSGFPSTFPSTTAVVMIGVLGDDIVYVTEDRKVWAWHSGTGAVSERSTSTATTLVAGTERPTYAVNRNLMIIAGGGAPQKVSAGSLVSERLGGSPSNWRDVAFITRRAVGVVADESGLFEWSDAGEPESYNIAVELAEAEARPDPLRAGKETAREYWAFGSRTLQIYTPDPDETFAPQVTLDVGCGAARSPIRREAEFAWLDDLRRFVWTTGRAVSKEDVISSPAVSRTVEGFTTVSDCWGYREKIGNADSFVWVFPTEGRALAYDTESDTWSERHCWSGGQWIRYCPTAYCYWPERNLHIVGLSDGRLAVLSREAYTDLDHDLKWLARSGYDDRGLPMLKEPLELQVRVRRGFASSSSSAIRVRWRDDLGPFSAPVDVALGTAGDHDHTVPVRPIGTPYRARQYELSGTAADATSVAKVTEVYEELDS